MKKLFLCLLMFSFTATALAHSPTHIEVSFNRETKILAAKIIHPVEKPSNHYIERVEIFLNGSKILRHEISRQDTENEQVVLYLIPDVKTGDELSVRAYCSITGEKEKKIKIE
ncbi:MAG: hypothetical protein AMJ95_00075 [Omnitrophica WOR_2 bacterium SM23_72]|nr:MAG: hypothetical protein AMJ95_00075 [Omnitrophica WOR_2 bacterium SM23_72]